MSDGAYIAVPSPGSSIQLKVSTRQLPCTWLVMALMDAKVPILTAIGVD